MEQLYRDACPRFVSIGNETYVDTLTRAKTSCVLPQYQKDSDSFKHIDIYHI